MPGLNLVRIYMYFGNTFDFISQSPAAKVCLLSQSHSAVQSQKAVLFTLQVRRYCLFGFSGQNWDTYTFNSLDLFHDTMCVQAHLNVYCSGGQMLAALAQNFTIIRATESF